MAKETDQERPGGQGQPRQPPSRVNSSSQTGAQSNESKPADASSKTKAGVKGTKEVTKQAEKMAKIKTKIGVLSLLALVFLLLGSNGMILWQSFYDNLLKKELTLSPNSMSYQMWKETPIPMYLKIYLYNWSNPHEVFKDPSIKPNFNQLGPYVFREVNTKVNQVWNTENATITFQQRRVWHFEEKMSNGSLSDKVTTINPIAVTVAYIMRNRSKFLKAVINTALKEFEKDKSVTKTAKEFLFDGYDDILLKLGERINISLTPFDKFGWFYSRNGSENYDGIFNIMTGQHDLRDIGMLKEWKYNNVSPYFSKTCGELKGTNGDLWPPLPDNKTVSVFSPDICTTLTLKEAGESEWLGVTGSKYISDADMLDNGTNVESRKCYCQGVECQPSGMLNVSSCKFGAPAFVSLPHFYLADESYSKPITGMKPNKKDHEFILIVEPGTGIPMQVRAALQINFLLQPDKDIDYFKGLPKMYVPMLWFTQEVNLTATLADQVKLLLLLPPIGKWTSIGIISIGVLLILFSIFIYLRHKRDDLNENLIPRERETEEAESDAITVE